MSERVDALERTTPMGERTSLPPLSLLELALVEEGATTAEALAATVASARRAEELGFRRVWVAEHHGYRSVGSVAPAVLTARLAAETMRVRVGSGGVLLTNHSALAVAEQFTTLAALYPDRIDLGIGRGPGTTDPRVVGALRRSGESYRDQLTELLAYLAGTSALRVVPGLTAVPAPWLLASSAEGAALAGELGLPLAFAYHIRPDNALEAVTRYREAFRPSQWCADPYVLASVETCCAPSDAEATELGLPARHTMALALQGQGPDARLLSPAQASEEVLPAALGERLDGMRAAQAHGSPETVRRRLRAVAELTGADELMLSTPIYDPVLRARSLELVCS
ncbi:MsnO8 family LLM class oxidoreductase [Amycolatopsis sp. NPDC005232]|uniref:MsnO8 family LLM class oxidoreductase n=1 Tax=Amycolatopsis sp. NPDC005232 TaxID=3157027 RepID=UPI0033A38C3E